MPDGTNGEIAGHAEIGFVLQMDTNSILVSDFGFRNSSFQPQAGIGFVFSFTAGIAENADQ